MPVFFSRDPLALLKFGLKMVEELRRFNTVDNQEAVKIGELEKSLESLTLVKPTFTADFPESVLREGADQLTLRRCEEGMLSAPSSVPPTWGTIDGNRPLEDECLDAVCHVFLLKMEAVSGEIVSQVCRNGTFESWATNTRQRLCGC